MDYEAQKKAARGLKSKLGRETSKLRDEIKELSKQNDELQLKIYKQSGSPQPGDKNWWKVMNKMNKATEKIRQKQANLEDELYDYTEKFAEENGVDSYLLRY
jgi:hypothetical protein